MHLSSDLCCVDACLGLFAWMHDSHCYVTMTEHFSSRWACGALSLWNFMRMPTITLLIDDPMFLNRPVGFRTTNQMEVFFHLSFPFHYSTRLIAFFSHGFQLYGPSCIWCLSQWNCPICRQALRFLWSLYIILSWKSTVIWSSCRGSKQ